MTISPSFRNFLWVALGATILVAIMLAAFHFYKDPSCAEQILAKAKKAELVAQMSQELLSASEAEKSAVLAVTDQDSQTYADQARAGAALVEQKSAVVQGLLEHGGTGGERALLAQFSRAFAELRGIDDDLLTLAVKNTNLKAYGLAFGPAAEGLKEVDDALSRLIDKSAAATFPEAKRVMLLAAVSQSAVLRIQILLAPHIAQESDQKMADLEAMMTREDQKVRQSLDGLAALVRPDGRVDLNTAVSAYARVRRIREQILALSRENTNVRSLAISLNQKRKAMLSCRAFLTALEQAIQDEPTETLRCASPR